MTKRPPYLPIARSAVEGFSTLPRQLNGMNNRGLRQAALMKERPDGEVFSRRVQECALRGLAQAMASCRNVGGCRVNSEIIPYQFGSKVCVFAFAVSPLRQKLIDDMTMRHFSAATQRNYFRDVGRFGSFLRRSPDAGTIEDVRQFQLAQSQAGVPVPTMNTVVSALRLFFANTLDRPDLARKLVRVSHPRNLPVVLSRDEITRMLNATTNLKHQAALSGAYGAGLRVGDVAMLRSAISAENAC